MHRLFIVLFLLGCRQTDPVAGLPPPPPDASKLEEPDANDPRFKGGVPCGGGICPVGEVCCNPVMRLCAPKGTICAQ